MDSLTLRQIKSLPENAVFALISDSNKECYISHTTNLRTRIGEILTYTNDVLKEDTRLVVLCTGFEDIKYKRIYAQYYVEKFKRDGYSIIGTDNYINYKAKIILAKELDRVAVVLVNTRKDKEIVGLFRSVDEAQEFIDTYYKGDIVLPVYAINGTTREWIGI